MSGPIRYVIGDVVQITEECLKRMRASNRFCKTAGYPTQSFIDKAELCAGVRGEVTHTFPPGYEVTAKFGDQSFHMKDNWIEKV